MAIKSAQGYSDRIYIGDKVRYVGDTRVEVAAGFKPDKMNGLQLITATARHWIGMPAKYYEVVERGPNYPETKPTA